MSQGDDPNNYRPHGHHFSGGQYTDMIANNIIASNMAKILKADFSITPLNILKLLLLLSTNEIKNGLNLLLRYLFDLIKRSPELSIWLVGKWKRGNRNQIRRIQIVDQIEQFSDSLTITVDFNFMRAFYNYIHKNDQVSFQKSLEEIKNLDIKDFIIIN